MAGEVTLTWSGTYTAVPSPQNSTKDLRGDKIILPQSALEQLLAASSAGRSNHPAHIPLSVHIETINAGVERLETARSRIRAEENERLQQALVRARGETRMIEGGT